MAIRLLIRSRDSGYRQLLQHLLITTKLLMRCPSPLGLPTIALVAAPMNAQLCKWMSLKMRIQVSVQISLPLKVRRSVRTSLPFNLRKRMKTMTLVRQALTRPTRLRFHTIASVGMMTTMMTRLVVLLHRPLLLAVIPTQNHRFLILGTPGPVGCRRPQRFAHGKALYLGTTISILDTMLLDSLFIVLRGFPVS
ncbi:hypothetical protein HDK64DRAFT_267506 [Phyllosticta capitalensis]